MQNQNPESKWFGDQQVTPEEKTQKVIGVFDNVADRYDLMNDLMSGGIHRIWKERFIHMIRPKAIREDGQAMRYLDVAGGTGDIAFRIRKKTGPCAEIILCDLNENMLSVGRNRAIDRGWINGFEWVTGNAESLPLPDSSVDIYTIAFGLRNVTHIDTALKEAHRVLRKGGKFFCLEFSHVKPKIFSKVYDTYSSLIIPQLGKIIADDKESYQYLIESIRKFPTQENLLSRMLSSGFTNNKYTNFSSGIVAVHQGEKG